MTTSFDLLHRNVQRKLWDMGWTELRSIQDQAIRHLLLGGGDAVIASPTASGKTEAAFLPVLSAIADSPAESVRAIYIGPLKALINDQFRRLEDLCGRLEMPVWKWHGDVSANTKHHLLDAPSGVLLITPESLEAILVRRPTAVPKLFKRLAFVVVDEMHSFMGTERGAQLISQLHRLCRRAGCDPVRIGLSATLGEPEKALKWLKPGAPPAVLIHDSEAHSGISIKVRALWKPPPTTDLGEPEELEQDPTLTELARAILLASSGKTNLVFANAKSAIELLADALSREATTLSLPDEIVVHHGSLSRERRLHAEERLRLARVCTAVCSNTLELGIDIGNIDEVVQVSAPWSVASLVQRLGRSGRREDSARVLRGFFVERVPDEKSDVWDRLHLGLVQGLATIELMLEGFLEPPALGRGHLSTIIHQCLAYLAETGGATASALFQRINGCGAFGVISQSDFGAMLREIGRRDLIEQMGDDSLILGLLGQRVVEHYSFFAAFNAPEELRVVHDGDAIGAIAMPPPPGEHLILAGRRWRVDSIDVERREVLVSPARGARAPRFAPSHGNVHSRVHAKMKALLLDRGSPTYVDSITLQILAKAREQAALVGGFSPAARPIDGGVRLFVFGGSKVQDTLALVFSSAGLQMEDRGVGFDVQADVARVVSTLRGFVANPDLGALARHADRVLQKRELGPEKFDRFVAPEVWQRAYVRDELDAEGAIQAAWRFADELTFTGSARTEVAAVAASEASKIFSVRHSALESIQDLCEAIAELGPSTPLPVRCVIVEDQNQTHAVKRELARSGRSELLAGTRFITVAQLATDILQDAGISFQAGEETWRTARLRTLFRDLPPLRYFDPKHLKDAPGWDEAFATTIHDLESAGLTPGTLAGSTIDPRTRDVADIWAALDAAAGNSWTPGRIIREATVQLADTTTALQLGPVLAPFSGHEARVEVQFVSALPAVTLAAWASRPRRTKHVERIKTLFGFDAARVWNTPPPPSAPSSELGLLRSFFFDDPIITTAADRQRSLGRDETVEVEQHDGVESEIEAAMTWLQHEVSVRGTPLEEIGLLVPELDPLGAILADRIVDLDLPVHVVGGLPANSAPECGRILTVLRALASFLDRESLVTVFTSVRVARFPRDKLTRSEALEAFAALGTLGGSRSHPIGALEWPLRLARHIASIESALSTDARETKRDEEKGALKRTLTLLRLVEEPLAAMVRAAEPWVRGAALPELWAPLECLLRERVSATASGAQLLDLFAARMLMACTHPATREACGDDALRFLEQTLMDLRLESMRFGDPAITVATIQAAAAAGFTAVRVLGLGEGKFPGSPREDTVLPDARRRELHSYGLRGRSDLALARLHALDRVVRNVKSRIVLSAPRRDLDGTYREPSPVLIEAAIALGRGGVPVLNDHELHRMLLTPAQRSLEAMREGAPLRQGTWLDRAAKHSELSPAWGGAAHVEVDRGRELLDAKRASDSLDGIFPQDGWFPAVPGLTQLRPLSASRWRTFLECPHRFLYEALLGLYDPRSGLDDGGLDAMTYGILFHKIIETFYRAHGEAFVARTQAFDWFEVQVQAIADAAFAASMETYALAGDALRGAQRDRLRRDLRALLETDWEVARERLVAVEQEFGTIEPLELLAGGRTIYVRGYVDRIEVEEGAGMLCDVKTGKPKPRKPGEIDPRTDAQLGLYALVAGAMRQTWGLPVKLAASYKYPAGVGSKERAFRGPDFELLRESSARWLEMTAALGTERSFPRTTNAADCMHCPFQPVCGPQAETRANQVLGSAQGALETFRRMKEG